MHELADVVWRDTGKTPLELWEDTWRRDLASGRRSVERLRDRAKNKTMGSTMNQAAENVLREMGKWDE